MSISRIKQCFALVKIGLFLICLVCWIATTSFATPTFAQEVLKERISLSMKDITLKTLLNAIEKKVDVSFSYKKNILNAEEKLNVEIKNEPIEVVLTRYLLPRQISFKITKSNIIILSKNTSGTGSSSSLNVEAPALPEKKELTLDQVVKGRVTDTKGEGIPGVSVVILGTTKGTATDANGNYSISISSPNETLVFSFIGMETIKIIVGTRSTLDVQMKEQSRELEAVVVTALGFEAKKDQIGYATSRISDEKIANSGEVGLVDALGGKASGVRISRTSGEPGAASQILIRGQSTITRGTDPLIVLDGVPIAGDSRGESNTGTTQQSRLNDISPDDIANIQVLKGASAAALWGTRAANGVIMITTKKGRTGTMNVSLKTTVSMDEVSAFYDLQSSYGQGSNGVWSPTALRSWGDKIDARSGAADVLNTTTGGYFIGNTGQKLFPIATKNAKNTYLQQNYDAVLGRGHYVDNAISLSGGDAQSNFFISLNDLYQQGIIKNGSNYRRSGFRVNASRDLTKWLTISNKTSYSLVNSDRIQTGVNNAGFLIGLLRNPADFEIADFIGSYYSASGGLTPNRQRSYRNQVGASNNPGFNNPLWVTNELQNTSLVNRFINSTEIRIRPVNWFTLTTRGGIDYFTDRQTNYFPYFSANAVAGNYNRNEYTNLQVNLDIIAQAERQLSKNLSTNILVGFNYNSLKTSTLGATSQNFILPDGPLDFDNATPSNISIADTYLNRITNAGYTSVGFAYKEMLFVNATGRLEAASTFGELADKTFFYPSADIAWQFSQLSALRTSSVLSFGKLRMAYGVVGVQPLSYRTQTNFVARTFLDGLGGSLDPALYGTGTYLESTSKGNPFLRPERKEEIEMGTDLRFLNDRLSVGFTYYQNNTKDALISIPQASSTGFETFYANAGNIENKGVELDLGYTIVKNKEWTVEASLNWTRNRNRVTNLSGAGSINLGGTAGVSSRAVEGYALGVLYSTPWQRNESGALKLDANGFPIPDIVAAPVGDPNPDWRGGFSLNVKYKKWTLSALVEHSQGGLVVNGTEGVLLDYGTSAAVGKESVAAQNLKTYDGKTIAAGTAFRGNIKDFGAGPVALEQAWYTGPGGWFGNVGEQFLEDATWTRFRELNLSYTLSHPALKKAIGLSSLVIELSGRNLFLQSKVQGYDPDSNVSGSTSGRGVVYFVNPPTRSYLATLKLNF